MIAAVVSGTIGRDGELKRVGDGQVLEFSVASRRFEKGEEKTDWIRVAFWGQRASKLTEYIKKGGKVAARGSLFVREYMGKDGKAFSLEMRADDVELLGSKEQTKPREASGGFDDMNVDELPF